MIHVSIPQALYAYNQLLSAYYNDNKYGGNTAEIYAYTLCERNPLAERAFEHQTTEGMGFEELKRVGLQAASDLHALIDFFLDIYDEDRTYLKVTIDGKDYKVALLQPLIHRIHVQD